MPEDRIIPREATATRGAARNGNHGVFFAQNAFPACANRMRALSFALRKGIRSVLPSSAGISKPAADRIIKTLKTSC
jgi:hypothetical protein